jgi:hypothetical protein
MNNLTIEEKVILAEIRKHCRGNGISQKELKKALPFKLSERRIRLIIAKLINEFHYPICSDPGADTGGYWWPKNYAEVKEVATEWAIKANKLKHRERNLLKGWLLEERRIKRGAKPEQMLLRVG